MLISRLSASALPTDLDEIDIVIGLFAACLDAARQQGRRVQFEVSDEHKVGMAAVAAVPTQLYEGLVLLIEPLSRR